MRNVIATRGLLLAGLVLLGKGANAQITKQGDSYLFRQKFTKGQTLHYTVNSSSSAPGLALGGGAFKMEAGLTLTVLSVSNGMATVKLTREAINLNGKAQGQPQSTILKIDSRGQEDAQGEKRSATIGPVLPEKPLKIGDTFTSQSAGMSGGQETNVKSTFRFIGLKNYRGKQVAQLSLTSGASGMMSGTSTGVLLYSLTDGQIVSATTDSKMSLNQQGKSLNINSHAKMELK